ncbi:hypothetical protein P171DRAFT_442431 [Karstenula rhodostoma CBS 690.94]|uniref:F-box domain-containing protein n=1 Tax=Karstenula rhodostoma CBS 690.94 TaxID=1392251 RepID=A0A9P4PLH5_9PLEO|nr:hypothetical protein P171DRAFT_442431 [Karstenula rhodostoma CBS 690.94]
METLPPEITYSVLEMVGNTLSVEKLFDLRLVNRLFDVQVIRVAIRNGRISHEIKTRDNTFGALSDRIKCEYLHFAVDEHARGRPSAFSTIVHRTHERDLIEHNVSLTDTDDATVSKRERNLRWHVDHVQLWIFDPRFYHYHWVLFQQDQKMRSGLQMYDRLFHVVYHNATISLALYLLLQCWHSGVPFIMEKVRTLLSIRVPAQWELAFTHEILSFAITTDRVMFDFIFAELGSKLQHIPLRPYIEAAVLHRPDLDPTSAACGILARTLSAVMAPVNAGTAPAHEGDCILLGVSILAALQEGETEVSAIIIHRMTECKTTRQLDDLFADIYGDLSGGLNMNGYGFSKERMEAVKQQARYRLIWQHRSQSVAWKILSRLHYIPHYIL